MVMTYTYRRYETEEAALEAVKIDGANLRYIEHQTPQICCEAVKECPSVIEYVRDKEMFYKVAKALAIVVE